MWQEKMTQAVDDKQLFSFRWPNPKYKLVVRMKIMKNCGIKFLKKVDGNLT